MIFTPIDDDKARKSTSDFTNLALLLRLLCFLNSKTTSPTVTGPLSKGPGEAARNANASTLEGVATILVQDHEVIATTHSTTSAVLAASESELGAGGGRLGAGGRQPGAGAGVGAAATSGTDLDVQTAHPSTSEAGKSQFNMDFAAVPNPDEKLSAQNGGSDAISRNANPHNLRVLEDGSDLSDAIEKYEWAYVLTCVVMLPVSSESVLIFMLIVQGTAIHTGPCDDGLRLPQQI
jgi:hypothetical protein